MRAMREPRRAPAPPSDPPVGAPTGYLGGIRSAPSSRIASPFSIVLETISQASCPYSSGRPSREGKGIPAPSAWR